MPILAKSQFIYTFASVLMEPTSNPERSHLAREAVVGPVWLLDKRGEVTFTKQLGHRGSPRRQVGRDGDHGNVACRAVTGTTNETKHALGGWPVSVPGTLAAPQPTLGGERVWEALAAQPVLTTGGIGWHGRM